MWEIEIDVDGVLADMDGAYGHYVNHIIPNFNEEEHILNWGMPEVSAKYPEAFEIIKSLWTNPAFFTSLNTYPKVKEAIIKLGKIANNNANVVIHTHVFDGEGVYEKRYEWLETLKHETGVNFKTEISQGNIKSTRTNTDILIEDNVTNLYKSNAKYKILIRRGHNRSFNENDLGDAQQKFVVKDFYEAVEKIENILELKKV